MVDESPGCSEPERIGGPESASPEGRARNRRAKAVWTVTRWLMWLIRFGGVIATAWWQGHAEQLEKPSWPQREIAGGR